MNSMLIHVPKGFCSESWDHNYINIMPMGLFSIANYCAGRGQKVYIMNTSMYQDKESALNVIFDRIAKHRIQIVGLSVHWHLSSYDALRVVTLIKKKFPHVKCVIGGITASIFAKEFLNVCKELDVVIQGDGEIPFCEYIKAVVSNSALSSVPNLYWRRGQDIIFNGLKYVADDSELSSFDFNVSETMFELKEYVSGKSMFDAVEGNMSIENETVMTPFFLNIGRGCTYCCSYCAGNKYMFKKYFGRERITVRSPESIAKTINDAYQTGFRILHVCFDPPLKNKDDFYRDIFSRIPYRDITFSFESYDLPSWEFIRLCSLTFKKTILSLSPCFFDSEIMKQNKGYHYSLDELKKKIIEIEHYGNVEALVFFAITPAEDFSDSQMDRYLRLINDFKRNFGCRVSVMPVYVEPGAPWADNEKYDFGFFWEQWQKPLEKWCSSMCYGIEDVNGILDKFDKGMRQNEMITDLL